MSLVPAPASPTAHRRRPSTRLRDGRGHDITGGNRAAITAIDRFGDIVLRRGQGSEMILEAASATPECPMVQACGAAYHLLGDTRSGIEQAMFLLKRARRVLSAATDREIMFGEALSAIAQNRPREADSSFLALSETAPEDLLAGYIGHLHFLNHGRFDAMLVHARHLRAANPRDPFAIGMHSFALEEMGDTSAALDAAYEADAIDPTIAWVHHTFAHIFKAQRRPAEGLAWLMERAHHWDRCGSSMFTHNWWHALLLMLDVGDTAGALELYDRLIAKHVAPSVSSFINASSLLARLELRGVDVGSRWVPLAEHARQRIDEHVMPFIDLHYGFSLAFAEDLADCIALRRSAAQHASGLSGKLREAWDLAGLPMLDAIVACCLGDWRAAAREFAHAMPHIRLIGGSSQQRDIFRELCGHASLRVASFARKQASGRIPFKTWIEPAVSALPI
jgi:tetratricopeptide (TPR) repeat protein